MESFSINIIKMKYIKFVEDTSDYILSKNSFVGYIPIVENEKDLYEKLMIGLDFPYFGMNWDALIDMFLEFDWIDHKNIIIIHEGLLKLTDKDFRKYMEIVLRCLDYWIHYPSPDAKVNSNYCTEWELSFDVYHPHNILFVFSKNEEKQIMEAIDECMQLCCFERNLEKEEL